MPPKRILSEADKKDADREKRRLALLKEVKTETPCPGADALKNKSSRWKDVDWTNVHNVKKFIAALALEDVPNTATFRQDGGKGNRAAVMTYVRFLIQDHASKKRKAKNALDQKEKKARGACDLLFADLDQPAREAAWRAVLFRDGKVTMTCETFEARAGNTNRCQDFWKALKAEERAATRTKAKADGDVREMTREVRPPDAWQPGQNDSAMPFGEGVAAMKGPWSIGDPECKYIISVVEAAAKRRGVSLEDMGVDVAHFLLKTTSSREQKLRRHGMDNIGRCATKAVTTIRDLGLLRVRAGERCSSRLVAELRIAATRDAPEVSALGDSNRCDARADDVACGDAPRVGFGAAAGGVLGGGVAPRGALRSGRVGAADQRAAAVSDEAPASLGTFFSDWEQRVVDRASRLRSAPRERVVTAMTDADSAEASLDPRSPTFLVQVARCASPNLDDVPAIRRVLDECELHETPGGEGGLGLLKWGLMGIDPLTGKGVAGGFISTCEDIDKEESKKKGIGAKGRFYAPKIMHLALQKALVSGKLHFLRDLLTAFYCLYGKLFFALTFYAGGITWLKAQAMGFDTTLIPLEVPRKDVKKMPASIAKRFPGGISFESSDDLLPILEATNRKFFDLGKCLLWALAFAAYYGSDHPLARAALAAVGARKDDHERAASRVAACKKAIAALATTPATVKSPLSGGLDGVGDKPSLAVTFSRKNDPIGAPHFEPCLEPPPPTGGDACVSAVGAGACGDVFAAAAAPGAPFPSLKAACDAAKMPFTFKLRFAVAARGPGEPPMTEWYPIGDFAPVMRVLSSYRDWDAVRSNHSWVLESETCRAMEAAACASSAIFAGMGITEIAPPHSVAHVFDPTKECKHDQTYTIWAGVDFEIMLPGGTIISKSEFLLQALEKYMAARA